MIEADARFLADLESCALPPDQWTHRAHVRLAYLAVHGRSFDEAMDFVRARIQAYNRATNTPETPTRGYNETTTRAFLQLVAATVAAYGPVMPTEDSEAFCDTHSQLMSRNILRFFYSPERRMHPDAKATFVEPDLAPLPRIV